MIKINILKLKMIVFMLIIQAKNKNSRLNNDFAILIAFTTKYIVKTKGITRKYLTIKSQKISRVIVHYNL